MLVTGANGAGKTNLLEALHVGTQGFSPRTRADQQLIRLGADGARIALSGDRDGRPLALEVTLQQGGKRAKLNGAALRSAEQLRAELATLVFTPDRLAVVKGGPAARRAYFDRTLGRLQPSRAPLPVEYAAAVGQRNAALRRVQVGASTRDAVGPWTEQVATLGAQLVEYRRDALAVLSPAFAERAGELGLPDAALAYTGEPPTVESLEQRLERDLERGVTGLGPHLDDITIGSGARDLRSFGSQGEQRLAVLSLLLAEAEVIAEQRDTPPLVLLDDVLSELDATRRLILAERIGRVGQAVVTATGADALPLEPAQLLEVTPGTVSARCWSGSTPRYAGRSAVSGGSRATRLRSCEPGRMPWGRPWRATPGLRGSRGTGRCSFTPPPRPGRSSSAASPRRSSRSFATSSAPVRRGRSSSSPDRCRRPSPTHPPAARKRRSRAVPSAAPKPPRSPPQSKTPSSAGWSPGQPRRASRERTDESLTTGVSDTLLSARK